MSKSVSKAFNSTTKALVPKEINPLTYVGKKSSSRKKSSSSSGGGSHGGGGGSSRVDLAAEARKLAGVEYENLKKYLPLQTQLAVDITNEYGPKQSEAVLNLLKQFSPQFTDQYSQLVEQARTSELDSMLGLAPRLRELREAGEDPSTTELRNLLSGQLLEELRAGTQLTDDEERDVVQSSRSADFARGLGEGAGSANRESVKRTLAGIAKRDRVQQKASQWLSQQSSDPTINPLSAIPSISTASADSGAKTLFNAFSPPNSVTSPITGIPSAVSSIQLDQGQQGIDLNRQQYDTQLAMARANAARYGISL